MKKINFQTASFLRSVYSVGDCPTLTLPRGQTPVEIAVVGRSNVGKSSLINHLLKKNKLARTSATPGKTQAINFFLIDEETFLVDLPGYGFAKVAKTLKEQWSQFLEEYFKERSSLSLILLLLDIRRDPSSEDAAFFAWAQYHSKPILIVFTKCDKVSTSELKIRSRKIQDALTSLGASFEMPYVHTSIHDAQSRIILIDTINNILAGI